MFVVTGAAGFIGSNVVAELNEAGMGPVAACDWFGVENKWRNIAKHDVHEFIQPNNIRTWLRNRDVQAVIHMGGISATTEKNVDKLIEENVLLTVGLWEHCAETRTPFIYASSAATYGALETGLNDSEAFEDLRALKPLNAYGWSKAITDRILAQRAFEGTLTPPQWVGLKFFNVYGPNEYHKGPMMSVAARNFSAVHQRRPVNLFRSERPDIADGEQKRDFVYVKDCASTILWLLRNTEISGIFNIGTGVARSFNDLMRAIGSSLGVDVEFSYVDMPSELSGQYQYHTVAEMGKLEACGLNLNAFRSVEDGIQDYVLEYLATVDPYR